MKKLIHIGILCVGMFSYSLVNADPMNNLSECLSLDSSISKNTKIDDKIIILKEQERCISKFKYNILFNKTPKNNKSINKQALIEAKAQKNKNALDESKGQQNFLGQNFGYGFGVALYKDTLIDDAEVIGGIVRVKSKKKQEAKVLLEFHTFINESDDKSRGNGIFAALVANENDILGGIGVGWLWGFRDKSKNDGSGLSVGVGVLLENNVKRLADGFKENQALPVGETDVRFIKKNETSALLFISSNF